MPGKVFLERCSWKGFSEMLPKLGSTPEAVQERSPNGFWKYSRKPFWFRGNNELVNH